MTRQEVNTLVAIWYDELESERLEALEEEQEQIERIFQMELEDVYYDEMILAKARAAGDWDFYSDYYKDVYGVRPRWEDEKESWGK